MKKIDERREKMIILTKNDMAEILLKNGFFKFTPFYGNLKKVLKNLSYKDLKDYYKEYKENL